MTQTVEQLRNKINEAYLVDEESIINELLARLGNNYQADIIHQQAYDLVMAIRGSKSQQPLVEAFLHEYQLSSDEGIVLMGIAEALLRIPDAQTQDVFLQEKLIEADWHKHLQQSDSLLVNFATEALNITRKIEKQFVPGHADVQQVFSRLTSRLGMPIIRTALQKAMQQLAYQFVIAETIDKALVQSKQHQQYLYSFDMLGEAALTADDAERYLNAYADAIAALAKHARKCTIEKAPSISIKLSALCPRYEPLQHKLAVQQISSKLLYLAKKARGANISVTLDAEESDRLALSLDIYQSVITDPDIKGWSGFGLAVQAYQKRAIRIIDWLIALAASVQCRIPLRLVKGAYWDSEIKQAQVNGLRNYPVFTHKSATDVSYLACAQLMLSHPDALYPQFATHNAHTVAAILELGKHHPGFEFQRLHGMGEQLHRQVLNNTKSTIPCRIYAPVGQYEELLPYLVRRLLENGANTSFINQVENNDIAIETVIADPVNYQKQKADSDKHMVLPSHLFAQQRLNSYGVNLADSHELKRLMSDIEVYSKQHWQAAPVINGKVYTGSEYLVYNPASNRELVGRVVLSEPEVVEKAISSAAAAYKNWRSSKIQKRAFYLSNAADLLELNRAELVYLLTREAGKTIKDALAEIREAVDFCRYYAQLAIDLFDQPLTMPGPTGEENLLYQIGRGVFVCISPWNFPIAIFLGQVSAALVSGNTVIAKPATQTSLVAVRCIQLLHQAGIPEDVLHFLPGDGATIGHYLLSDKRIAGVAFTGSLATAQRINRQLAQLECIVPLIAETGGQNVMIADSSAHYQQLIKDVVESAFNSAGQRCSALRVLYVPYDIADKVIAGIIGMMVQLNINDPQFYHTDIGPLINASAVKNLETHVADMRDRAKVLFQVKLNHQHKNASFFPATMVELTSLTQLSDEQFGPILHVIRYQADKLDQVIDEISASGYGLTLGIHSRINQTINTIVENSNIGNIYINRNMISAVVGVQPFGGMGLSGTGPKAGGPHYLLRFASEQTVTTNTAAIGGNTQLLRQQLR